jgi:hypothetical protein
VWSPNAKNAKSTADLANQLGVGDARAYRSIAEMVADPAIDAIWLCGPNQARIENIEEIVNAVRNGAELRGLAWMDREAFERFGTHFVESTDAQRKQILDDIAWPGKAKPEMSQGVNFFNRFRDLTASGFFSTQMGYKDVRFVGGVFNPNFNGCPPEAMKKLGVSHDLMKTRVKVQYGQ